jgi:hypothetical protein
MRSAIALPVVALPFRTCSPRGSRLARQRWRSAAALPNSTTTAEVLAELRHAAEIRSWFHQDLYVASEFTGRDGTWVEPVDADVQLRALTH